MLKKWWFFLVVLLVILIIIGVKIDAPKKAAESQPSPTQVSQTNYKCENNKTIQAVFFSGPAPSVQPGQPPIPNGFVNLNLSDGRQLNLPQTLSADGIRFANSDESVIFWSRGDTAFVNEGDKETFKNCSVIK